MITNLLAQAPANEISWLVVGAIVLLLNLGIGAMTFVRMANGKGGERQIEPTQIAAIQLELKQQTTTLNNINREVGEVKTSVGKVEVEVAGLHQRTNGISRDLAATAAKVDSLERREARRS